MTSVGRKGGSVAIVLLMMWASFLSMSMTFSPNVVAGTVVYGLIDTDTTWTVADSPYWVVGWVAVIANVNLTIEEGVEVRFEDGAEMIILGRLECLGSDVRSVTMTSNRTNPTGPVWGNLSVEGQGRVDIHYTDISYALSVQVQSDWNIISNSKISHTMLGVEVYADNNTFSDLWIEYSWTRGMYFYTGSAYNKVLNSTIRGNSDYAIYIGAGSSYQSKILGNDIRENYGGIRAASNQGWEIACNNIVDSWQYGILLTSANAYIHHNNFLNNTDNAYDDKTMTVWDNGSRGNYWDDYNGSDTNGDDIGDIPYYILPQNMDNYPYMSPVASCPTWEPPGLNPIADARPRSQQVGVGQPAWFNGNNSWDPDGWIVSYYWLFGDGDSDFDESVSHAYTSAGTYTVTLRVTDNDNLTDEDQVTVKVGTDPVADAIPETQYVDVGELAWFNGSLSYDPDGWIVSYVWEFGDGDIGGGENATHAYDSLGRYTVTLIVWDNDGLWDKDYVEVIVQGHPPVADAGSGKDVYVNELVEFNGSGSYDIDGWIVDWLWDFGDGSPQAHGEVVYHQYLTPGVYHVGLTVTDNHDLTDYDSIHVNVTEPLEWPISDPNGPYSGRKNFPVLLTGNGSYDPDGTIVDLEWDFGDGSPTEHGWFRFHTYSSGGNFTVTLWVTDDDGLVNMSTTYAVIEDQAPGAPIVLDALLSGGSNKDVTMSWTPSPDDGGIEDDVVTYEVYYGTSYDIDGVGYSLLDTVPAGTATYTHTGGGHSDNNTYFYIVKAVDDAGQRTFVGQGVKLARHLPTGMQLISIPVLLSDTSISDVFQTVDFKRILYYDAMAGKRHNWKTFDTRKPYHSLTDVNEKMALWVEVETESHLVVAGLVPDSTTIRLVVGWNFVGYASFVDRIVGDSFAGAIYQNVEGFDPMDPPWYLQRLADSDFLKFGNGYWIHVSEEFLWTVTN
jgi:PKD repeat protein